jgi:23S rRNA (guanosine2251-2'-O)-methyltransferase
MQAVHVYGRHTFTQVVKNVPEAVQAVFVGANLEDSSLRDAYSLGVPVHEFAPDRPPADITENDVHQGIVVRLDPDKVMVDFRDFLQSVDTTTDPAIAICGELQDPHNVGAIIRSCTAFGLSAVLIPERRQAGLTPTVARASAGTAFQTTLVKIGNVNTTIEKLKNHDFWVYGLAGEADESVAAQEFPHPTAFVVGGEKQGIREKTREHCDKLVGIPIADQVESLNASVAAAVAFYQWKNRGNSV